MSLRIIGGRMRGHPLQSPRGQATRPTLGRIRKSLFMILAAHLPEARVLDLFAGSGALGLEALSRGACEAVFVESARPALEALAFNIDRLDPDLAVRIVRRDVFAFLQHPASQGDQGFGLVLIDPPYGKGLCDRAMTILAGSASEWLAPGACVVAQFGKRDPMLPEYGCLGRVREEDYSETRIAFYQVAD